jgi:long-chain acyl-CoA synthetase
LEEHPGVSAVAVVGLPNERLGQVVAAVLQPADGDLDLPELDVWLKGQLASYKTPKYYYVLAKMPRNTMNKIVKPTLREWIASGELSLAFEASRRKAAGQEVPG